MTDMPAGDPKLGHADTIYLCVVDKDRNCVSLIQSNYHGLRLAAWRRPTSASPSRTAARCSRSTRTTPTAWSRSKRPFHTIIPAMVTKDGKPWFTFGVMGGDMQPQGHVQVLVNLIDFGMNVQEAGEAPRVEHVGSATPTGRPGDADGGTVKAEPGIPDDDREGTDAPRPPGDARQASTAAATRAS